MSSWWPDGAGGNGGSVPAVQTVDGSSNNFTDTIFSVAVSGSTPTVAGLFAVKVGGQTFNSTFDPMMGWGYNWNNQSPPPVAGEPGFWWQMEVDYNDGSANRKLESYLAYQPGSSWQQRPIFFQVDATNQLVLTAALCAQTFTHNYDLGSGTVAAFFKVWNAGGSTPNMAALNNVATGHTMFQINADSTHNARLQLVSGTNVHEIKTAGGSGGSLQIQCVTDMELGPNAFSSAEVTITSSAFTLKTGVTLRLGSNQIRASGGSNQSLQLQCKDTTGEVDLGANAFSTPEIRAGNAQVGFFNKLVSQQTALGTTTGFTAATGTAVVSGSTFTGGSGTSAYTIGDIVLALKNYGLLAA